MAEDLWGDIPNGERQQTPISILRDQAGLITTKTREELIGKVLLLKSDTEFSARFRLEVPSLSGFTIDLFDIQYPIGLYPVQILSFVRGLEIKDSRDINDLKANLSIFFQSSEVRTIIQRLRTQIASME